MPFDAMPATPDLTLTVLMEARQMISSPQNWVKGHSRVGNARCAGQAIVDAYNQVQSSRYTSHHVSSEKIMERIHGDTGLGIVAFNDMAKTTHAMVLERFDDAITKRVAELTAAANTKRANELASMATAEG